MIFSALILGGFAALSTALLSITNEATRDAIALSEQQALLRSLHEILPDERYDNDLLADRISVRHSLLGTNLPVDVYRARLAGQDSAVIIAAQAPNGYNGRIKLLVGINTDGTLAGVRATSHKETPGLGDDIELARSDWVLGFNGKSLDQPAAKQWAVKKDGGVFDQFTGATITPRAVVGAVYNTLKYFSENRRFLFEQASEQTD
ncbi:MAG: electron transport complex subunit RsxG [Gammaproteobacteria bacterium]|nr:electron transport complex subunit RsxG [Gammaproteobacteria bacterium]